MQMSALLDAIRNEICMHFSNREEEEEEEELLSKDRTRTFETH